MKIIDTRVNIKNNKRVLRNYHVRWIEQIICLRNDVIVQLNDYTILDTSFENRDITSILKEFSERSLEKVFDSFTIRKSPGPHGGKRQTGRMKSKFNFSSLVIPVRCARISPVKPSHDYANSGIIYFSFALPFPSYPPRNRATPALPSTLSFGGGLLHGSSNFEVRRVFDVATNCSMHVPVRHAKQWITH